MSPRRVAENKAIRERSKKELENFADMLERAVINSQENDRAVDLQAGTLYTITLEKLPEKLLAQCYRRLNENHKVESLLTPKKWTAEEANYEIHATKLKQGLKPGNSNWKP